MNSQKKARTRFLVGLKQTTLVRRYAEIFEDLALEADFTDPTILHAAFYEGLKWDVRRDMVSKTPDMLAELKALAIQLDEERMGVDRRDNQPTTNHTPMTDSNEPACHATTSVKAEVARVGTSLSPNDRARYLHEGRCFSCGKTGHHRPDCPDGKPHAYVAAIEPALPEPVITSEQSKN
jgi:hypothetical protein